MKSWMCLRPSLWFSYPNGSWETPTEETDVFFVEILRNRAQNDRRDLTKSHSTSNVIISTQTATNSIALSLEKCKATNANVSPKSSTDSEMCEKHGRVSHKKFLFPPSVAYVRHKSFYFFFNSRGSPTKY